MNYTFDDHSSAWQTSTEGRHHSCTSCSRRIFQALEGFERLEEGGFEAFSLLFRPNAVLIRWRMVVQFSPRGLWRLLLLVCGIDVDTPKFPSLQPLILIVTQHSRLSPRMGCLCPRILIISPIVLASRPPQHILRSCYPSCESRSRWKFS